MEIKMVLFLPRDTVSVPVSRQLLDRCLETVGVTPDTRADIALALTEACANVIQHAGPGEEYEVQVTAGDWQCVIEVVNTGSRESIPAPEGIVRADGPVLATAEHGRGLRIMDAVVDNLQLTSNERNGTTLHFEKKLEWLPGAAGRHLFHPDGGS
jgi:serine/threonine-protein kinase RsbW